MSSYLINNHAYYPVSLNAHIREKQHQLRSSNRRPMPPTPIEEPLPIINLIPTEQTNVYKIDLPYNPVKYKQEQDELIACQEQILTHNHNKIKETNEYIEELKKTVEENEEQIKKQDDYIRYQIGAIHNYDAHTQQQLYNYNINLTVLTQQAQQIENQRLQIAQQQETIQQQQEEIDAQKEELDQLKSQVAYHNQMLGAFNTMVQNPEYFTQLMGSIMCASMVQPSIDVTTTTM